MNGHPRLVCDICGFPMEFGNRKRLLGQREYKRGLFTEDGWQIYAHPECIERSKELLRMLVKQDKQKYTIVQNYNAINSGVTDIFQALQNIMECVCAANSMHQEPKWSDFETFVNSIYTIANLYYCRLPVDCNGEPININDTVCKLDDDHCYTVCGIGDLITLRKEDYSCFTIRPNLVHHVESTIL